MSFEKSTNTMNSSYISSSSPFSLLETEINQEKKKSSTISVHKVKRTLRRRKPTEDVGSSKRKASLKSSKCGFTRVACLVFTLFFTLTMLVGNLIPPNDLIPDAVQNLFEGEPLLIQTNPNDVQFFKINVQKDAIVSIVAESNATIDTTLTLIRRPSDIILFNDDVASSNAGSILIFVASRTETLFIRMETLQLLSNNTFMEIEYNLIEQVISPGIVQFNSFPGGNIELYEIVSIEQGQTYEIIAKNSQEVDPLFITDSLVRIWDVQGNEVVEIFQSSLTEFTGRLLFVPPNNEKFILEVRSLRDADIEITLDRIVPIELPINTAEEPQSFDLTTKEATFLQLNVEENVKYTFDFLVNITFDQLDTNFFGYVFLNTTSFRFSTENVVPGVSIRVYDKETNEILQRERTQFPEKNIIRKGNNTFYDYIVDFEPAENGLTSFEFDSKKSGAIILDVSRWNLDYSKVTENEIFGFVSLSVSQEQLEARRDQLVDENDLFPGCDIDQLKLTIDDDTCERGIVLYCRHEIFPLTNTSTALKLEFQEICDCSNFLCATLPSGDDLSSRFLQTKRVFAGFFVTLCFIGILLFIIAHLELFIYGGFKHWILQSPGSTTWFLNFLFLVTFATFFITRLKISLQGAVMQNIAEAFNLNRIPDPKNEINYDYYGNIVARIIGGDEFIPIPQENLLNQEAINELEKGYSLRSLEVMVNFSLVVSMMKDVLAIIVYLDISLSWISTSASVQLNRVRHEEREKKMKLFVRVMEVMTLLFLGVFFTRLVRSSGQTFNVIHNFWIIFVSLFVLLMYFQGRTRLKRHLFKSSIKLGTRETTLWYLIQRVSTVVMFANIGVVLAQFYLLLNVQNFEDLVASENDPLTQMVLIFQDTCNFVGQVSIFVYVFRYFVDYRESLYHYVYE